MQKRQINKRFVLLRTVLPLVLEIRRGRKVVKSQTESNREFAEFMQYAIVSIWLCLLDPSRNMKHIMHYVSRFTFYVFGFLVFWGMGCNTERDFQEQEFQSPAYTSAAINLMRAPAFQSPELKVVIEVKRQDNNGNELDFVPPISTECIISDRSSQCRVNLEIPIGNNRIIDVKGFEVGNILKSEGLAEIDVVGDLPLSVNIPLDPVGVPLLKLEAKTPAVRVNDEVLIDIRVKNVNDLFGLGLELDYDKNRLFALGVDAHPDSPFKESDLPPFHDLNLNPTAGRMALALTLTKGQTPLAVGRQPEIIATVAFRALDIGTAQIKLRVVKSSSPKLTNPEGQELDRIDELRDYLEADGGRVGRGVAEVRIR